MRNKTESVKLKELRRIAASNGGVLRPPDIVKAAEKKSSPLHDSFTWDDSEAAKEYRLWQARQLILRVYVNYEVKGKMEPVRVFVSLKPDRESGEGYREVVTVLRNTDWRQQMIADALEELTVFQKKYRLISELAEIFDATESVRKKVSRSVLPGPPQPRAG